MEDLLTNKSILMYNEKWYGDWKNALTNNRKFIINVVLYQVNTLGETIWLIKRIIEAIFGDSNAVKYRKIDGIKSYGTNFYETNKMLPVSFKILRLERRNIPWIRLCCFFFQSEVITRLYAFIWMNFNNWKSVVIIIIKSASNIALINSAIGMYNN